MRAAPGHGPWIWGARQDLLIFGGSSALGLAVIPAARLAGISEVDALPAWAFLGLVLGVDVAHVWSTLFRTYLDAEELGRRPVTYAAVPLACLVLGVLLHAARPAWFWSVLAYVAVVHFVRQQVGWAAIYRALAGSRCRLERRLDEAALYAATLYPLLVWHAAPPRRFAWLIDGDFLTVPALVPALPWLRAAYLATLGSWAGYQLLAAARGRPTSAGKCLVVVSTAALWYVGIVATDGDLEFTATNVLAHGVPYLALLWGYGRERRREAPGTLGSRIVTAGLPAFFAVVLGLAFVEEALWDRLVWHDRPWLFGEGGEGAPGPGALAVLVPLLALPQATHYVLDALLWRRCDTGPAQARALGFRGETESAAAGCSDAGGTVPVELPKGAA